MQKSKYQKYEIETINRADISNAPYNPRIIDKEAQKRLKKGIKEHGLVSAITYNKRTGHICGGHQRLELLDSLERSQNYALDVCVIDVDEKEEAIINIQLNNPSMQGDWDLNKLAEMKDEFNIDFVEDMGFSQLDIDTMYDGLFSEYYEAPERCETNEKLDKVKEARKEAKEKYKENAKMEHYSVIIFADEDEKREFYKQINLPFAEQYITTEELERLKEK